MRAQTTRNVCNKKKHLVLKKVDPFRMLCRPQSMRMKGKFNGFTILVTQFTHSVHRPGNITTPYITLNVLIIISLS